MSVYVQVDSMIFRGLGLELGASVRARERFANHLSESDGVRITICPVLSRDGTSVSFVLRVYVKMGYFKKQLIVFNSKRQTFKNIEVGSLLVSHDIHSFISSIKVF